MSTEDKIFQNTKKLLALGSIENVSMRDIAKKTGITQSVIYYYFPNKESLLKKVFRKTSIELGKKRKALPETQSAKEMLHQRLEFQIDNIEDIVAVLKFYVGYRNLFPKTKLGYIPNKATLHIEEALRRGVKSGEFIKMNIRSESKVIAHAINGYLLEYYPVKPKGNEKKKIVEELYNFIIRSIEK